MKHTFRSLPGLHHIVAGFGVDPRKAAAQLAHDPSVEYVEPNFKVSTTAIPNDPLFPRQWDMLNVGQTGGTSTTNPDIGATAAWNITTGSRSIVIAVIDTGVDYTHQDLAANIFVNPTECNNNGLDNDADGYINDCHGINAITHTGNPMDDFFHGTHVAGTIGAVGNNAVGVTGLNWNVTILPCKFLDSTGSGTTADAITCFDYVAMMKDRGVNIVASNNSWGGPEYSQALHDAIVAQRTRGILTVAAAGNNSLDNDQVPTYPCSYDLANVVCVASAYDQLSIFSDYGIGTVHLAAPGEEILSTVPNNGYDVYDGTSMATPHVTGAIGLLEAQDPTRDWRALKNLILAGAVPATSGPLRTLTGGRLQVANSMSCTSSVVEARMRPALFETISLAVGDSLPLEAIHIKCADPNGNVTVTVTPSGETVTLVDDGTGNDEVAGDGIYSGSWTASTPGTYALTFPGRQGDVVNVQVDAQLKPGFPTKMNLQPDINLSVNSAPLVALVVGNIDSDSTLEILSPGYVAGPLYAWKNDGRVAAGWPNYDVDQVSQVSLGNFGGATPGVVAGFFLNGLHVYNGDGSSMAGWPQTTANLWYPAPTIDLDGDGIDEIIGYPARHADGTLVNGGAVPAAGANFGFLGPAAIADLDGDGQPDIVAVDNQNIWASNLQGLLPGFPVPIRAAADITIHPLIGDVDGDGKPNIIVPWTNYTNGAGYLNVNIYTNAGALLRTLTTSDPITNNILALADLDADGIPEIIASTGTRVYVWKGDGTLMPGFPISLGAGISVGPVAVGDIDGDGYPDIALISTAPITNGTYPGKLYAIDRHGVALQGFPKTIQSVVGATPPAIADLDGNGRNDLIVSHSPDMGYRDSVFVYDLRAAGPYGPIEWGQYMGAANHRGYYETGKNLPHNAFLAAQAHGAGAITSADGGISCGATCLHEYAKGATVQLRATANSGGTFTRWLGACAGQPNPCSLILTGYTSVAADFSAPVSVTVVGNGSVTSMPVGINCPAAACTAVFPARSQVTLNAVASSGSAFNGWSGGCSSSTGPTCTVPIEAAQSVTANFANSRLLTVGFTGAGTATVVSSPAGIDCGTTCSASFPPGSTVILTATSTDAYVSNWGVATCGTQSNTCTIAMSTDVSDRIQLALKPTVSVAFNGSGTVTVQNDGSSATCTSPCTVPADPYSQVQLNAVAANGFYFAGWEGDCSNAPLPCSLLAVTSQTVTVDFLPKIAVSVATSGSGAGVVSATDGGLACPSQCTDLVAYGAQLTLIATPDAKSTFAGWSGACSGTGQSCTLTITAATSLAAAFTTSPNSGDTTTSGGGSATSPSHSGGGGAVDLVSLAALLGIKLAYRCRRRARSTCRDSPAVR